ncbi:DUF4870 domain-containing protein [Chitinibacter fontanus]|uniref:DUF4870 domain-containing protein n=1 Tax=Chitinibacter fontanus TaxID=1737446 RepID=A0A7D5VA24_9NEIS|nr:DUF4870 domain-containing protein [Chitinibacter fontanus]QLI81816.1 DUF4870 domain-containing protein [Chitinibacter fontanus]
MFILNPKPAYQEEQDNKPKPPKEHEKFFAVLAHLAGLFWLPILPAPIVAIALPFIVLQFARVHSDFVEQHAREACNFQMLMGCFYIFALVATYFLNTTFLLWWVGVGASLFSMWQGGRAINGWQAKYPAKLNIFK